MRSLSLAELLTMGWQLHPTLGLRKRGFTSVAFEFFWEDIRIGAVQGYGNTVDAALADAVIWANHWLQEQPSRHWECGWRRWDVLWWLPPAR